MNVSQFMDKEILGLAAAGAAAASSAPLSGGGGGELFDLMSPNPQAEVESHNRHVQHGGAGADEVMPSYDFQPIRAAATAAAAASAANPWGSLDSKAASSNIKSAGILEPHMLQQVSHEEERSNLNAVTIADIDRTMKKYADNLLHALEGVSSNLLQLEGRTHHIENSVGELKLTIGNYNGSTDGKLRQFENTLREVQAGVQILRDKQEIVETRIQLTKLQVSKADDAQSENAGAGQADPRQQPTPPQPTMQPQHQGPPPSQPPALPAPPALNAPPTAPLQNQPPPQFPGHLPHSLVQSVPPSPSVPAIPQEPYYPPSAQPTDATHQQYQAPQPQTPPVPPQRYQTPPQYAQYSQPPPPPASVNPSAAVPPSVPQQPQEAAPYGPPAQSYPPNVRAPAPPFYGPNPGMCEPPAARPYSGPPPSYNTGYKPQGGGGFSEPYGYSGSPSHRGNAGIQGGASSGGSGSYGRLPAAQTLPHAAPVSSTPSAASGNGAPIDDVVEKVATMGFSREQARAAVRKLTENGQSVDLNVVLDKLTNDTDAQPLRAWLGR